MIQGPCPHRASARQAAERSLCRALTECMTFDATFAGARQATFKAASDLFGCNSNEVLN